MLVELFPGGFEECEVDAGVELAAYAEGDEEAKLRAVFGSVQADDVEPGWEERWREDIDYDPRRRPWFRGAMDRRV